MKLALNIHRLVPAGGLERHVLRFAEEMIARGHDITIVTSVGAETAPAPIRTVTLKPRGWSNHATVAGYADDLVRATASGFDLVVGFQKMRGLDMLFCADWCYAERKRSFLQRLAPRHRLFAGLEEANFARSSKTLIMALAAPQLAVYRAVYNTQPERTAVLPPTLDPQYRPAALPDAAMRAALRARHDIAEDRSAWLWVGLQPRVKGLDRAIAALVAQPAAMLLVCGPNPQDRDVRAALLNARRLGVADRVRLLGLVSPDVLQELFAASDLLVHPARLDVTAMVILEAMASGLPVVTTANCGFSSHVEAADAGLVVPVPFDAVRFDQALAAAQADGARRQEWSRNAFAYCADPALYSGLERACDLVEAVGRGGVAAWTAMIQAAEGQALDPVAKPT
jgi:UDP-glucose:(heptosyl)LPS alpha-1,3-glucosyltransferase